MATSVTFDSSEIAEDIRFNLKRENSQDFQKRIFFCI